MDSETEPKSGVITDMRSFVMSEFQKRALFHDQAAELLRAEAKLLMAEIERHEAEAIQMREEAFNLWKGSQNDRKTD